MRFRKRSVDREGWTTHVLQSVVRSSQLVPEVQEIGNHLCSPKVDGLRNLHSVFMLWTPREILSCTCCAVSLCSRLIRLVSGPCVHTCNPGHLRVPTMWFLCGIVLEVLSTLSGTAGKQLIRLSELQERHKAGLDKTLVYVCVCLTLYASRAFCLSLSLYPSPNCIGCRCLGLALDMCSDVPRADAELPLWFEFPNLRFGCDTGGNTPPCTVHSHSQSHNLPTHHHETIPPHHHHTATNPTLGARESFHVTHTHVQTFILFFPHVTRTGRIETVGSGQRVRLFSLSPSEKSKATKNWGWTTRQCCGIFRAVLSETLARVGAPGNVFRRRITKQNTSLRQTDPSPCPNRAGSRRKIRAWNVVVEALRGLSYFLCTSPPTNYKAAQIAGMTKCLYAIVDVLGIASSRAPVVSRGTFAYGPAPTPSFELVAFPPQLPHPMSVLTRCNLAAHETCLLHACAVCNFYPGGGTSGTRSATPLLRCFWDGQSCVPKSRSATDISARLRVWCSPPTQTEQEPLRYAVFPTGEERRAASLSFTTGADNPLYPSLSPSMRVGVCCYSRQAAGAHGCRRVQQSEQQIRDG